MLCSCQTSIQQKRGDHIQDVQIYIQLLHEFGFHITNHHADEEFDPLQDMVYKHMPGGEMINITSANKHVPEIEWWIIFFTEITKSVRHILPFNKIPNLLTIYIFFAVVRMLNYFLVKWVVSAILSPKTRIFDDTLHYKRHLRIKIGHYCQVHEHEEPRNSQLLRTKGAICLVPSGNEEGVFLLMSLKSEKYITKRSWDTTRTPYTTITKLQIA